jgi:hypothetical protein
MPALSHSQPPECVEHAVAVTAAAGGSVEPFWGLYQQHQKPEIRDILSKYRIGTLKGAPKQAAVQQVSAGPGPAGCLLVGAPSAQTLCPLLPGHSWLRPGKPLL